MGRSPWPRRQLIPLSVDSGAKRRKIGQLPASAVGSGKAIHRLISQCGAAITRAFWRGSIAPPDAALAQLVEHVIRNDGVAGSSPACGTTLSFQVGIPFVRVGAWHGARELTPKASGLLQIVRVHTDPDFPFIAFAGFRSFSFVGRNTRSRAGVLVRVVVSGERSRIPELP